VNVEIQDVFDCCGIKLACIRALDGKPFVSGDKWPVATSYTTVPASDLSDIKESTDGRPQSANLLIMALAAARPQWPNSESVWLVGNPRNGAYLKNVDGWVYLFVIGVSNGLPIFYFDPALWKWKECRQVREDYLNWAAEAKHELECGIKAR
jgi:hypothetical protein